MKRKPFCDEDGLNKGAWTALEDKLLVSYINAKGEGKWTSVPTKAGLNRRGKSCRLRWLNYLRPNIKRGNFSGEEEELIIRLHKLLGNRWSLIAGRLPGRTDNEIKNYWNTTLSKKLQNQNFAINMPNNKLLEPKLKPQENHASSSSMPALIRTKALRCTEASYPCFPLQIPASTDGVDQTKQISQQNFGDESMEKGKDDNLPNFDLVSFDDEMWFDGMEFEGLIRGDDDDDDDGIMIEDNWTCGSLETDIWMNF